ncbi:MAG TPA: FHA domain-containing protein, partial [Pirellulaceae bacterium]
MLEVTNTVEPPENRIVSYLVIREGPKWTDVFRLVEGRTITIGRAPTNHIVIKDERCSRCHAEIFCSQGNWTVRDLESRNGTEVGGERIRGDYVMTPGEIVRIAHAQLAFVHDLNAAFADSSLSQDLKEIARSKQLVNDADSVDDSVNVLTSHEPTTITHRRDRTRFIDHDADETVLSESSKARQATAKLWRLAFELAKQTDIQRVAQLALDGLLAATNVDAGAVYLLPRDFRGEATEDALNMIASRTDRKPKYHRLSKFLATTVLREGEAVLARNVEDDSLLGSKDSRGEIQATSIICAPIRQDGKVIGVIHLYSTDDERRPDPDDLEFTLAVADNVALALKNVEKQQELTENLSQTMDEIVQLRKRLGAESELIGSSAQMMRVHQEVLRAAPSRATILIRGESGVGKELVAR